MPGLTIDGRRIKAQEGTTVLEAARSIGIYIPALCAHPEESPFACRLCIVKIEGWDDFPTACTTPIAQDMVVRTSTPELNELRRESLEKILADHPYSCLTCPKSLDCELQRAAQYIGLERTTPLFIPKERQLLEGKEPFFDRDYDLCIRCGQCVAICHEVRGVGAITFIWDEGRARVDTASGGSLKDSGCKFCGACVEVCPTGALMERALKWKHDVDREAILVPCHNACPAGIDIPRYVRLLAEGRFAEALAVIREKVPFPTVLGRVCFHPCEDACRRNELNEPISIKALKRFASEHDDGLWREGLKVAPPSGRRVAIVGSGPTGLTAAYYLAKLGHSITVFEALAEPGGMMRVGIPEYRLPRDLLNAEIDVIKGLGVDIKTNVKVDSLQELFQQGYNAIFLALGAHRGVRIGVEGEELPGVIECVSFLQDVNLGREVRLGDRVAVIGGGNAAMDASRTALRLGSRKVTILYRRTRAEMPANPEEVEEAIHEGVELVYLVAPNRITRENNMLRVECLRMRLGEPDASGRRRPEPIAGSEFSLEFDTVLAAIGQMPEVPSQMNLSLGRGDRIQVDPHTLATSIEGVFAGGDVVTGAASVIEAIAAGRKAASSIDRYLGGKGEVDEILLQPEATNPWLGKEEGFADRMRCQMPSLDLEQRLKGFAEVELGYSEEQAVAEAKRCLRCDLRLQVQEMPLPIKAKAILNPPK